jgi:UDPglucose 6-dehydrogenase
MRMTVIGTGYLGAVHAACMAELGHDVLGVDADPQKVDLLASGRAPFFEPGLPEMLARGVESGRLRFTVSLAEAAEFADVHFVCVGTPQRPGSHAADVSHVDAVVQQLARLLRRPGLVVGKSTVPVGTASRLAALVADLAPAGSDVDVAWNPEFLSEGFAVRDTLHPDRVVVGVRTERAGRLLQELYEPLLTGGAPFIVTDLATAELVKVAANAFLATKVSFINAMAEVCEATGADVSVLAGALGHDPRIGSRFLAAGLGFGGGCLPKDIRAFMARSVELGVGEALTFLGEVDRINMRRRRKIVETATAMLGHFLADKQIAVLGASFKPNSDDVRDSPALDVAASLQRGGARVRVHDPQAIENARAAIPTLDYTDDVTKALEGAHLTLHLTEWGEYRDLDPAILREVVAEPRLLDGRNALDLGRWARAGWVVRSPGRPAPSIPRSAVGQGWPDGPRPSPC